MNADELKRMTGEYAVKFIEDGMVVGLGTGSTADWFVKALGKKVKEGFRIKGIPTSVKTETLAMSLDIPLVGLDDVERINVTVDGADEIDPRLRLIKGGGGALLREKIVADASDMIVTIADESKLVDDLGAFPLPVEIVDFAPERAVREISALARDLGCDGSEATIRQGQDGKPFVTDGGHLIVDCAAVRIPDPDRLEADLNAMPFVVENGLFIGLSTVAVIGGPDGVREVRAS